MKILVTLLVYPQISNNCIHKQKTMVCEQVKDHGVSLINTYTNSLSIKLRLFPSQPTPQHLLTPFFPTHCIRIQNQSRREFE